MTQPDYADHMPYVRDPDRCDLCGTFAGDLERVVLDPGDGEKRIARVIYVCHRHAERQRHRARAPRAETLPGTSRKQPQAEQLFGGAAACPPCRYPAICPPCVHATAAEKLAANDAAGLREGRAA